MADDNEQNEAHKRATTYHQFADIVQHYDETAYVDHDNIDYTTDSDFDGIEFDHNGEPVISIEIVYLIQQHIVDIAEAIDNYGSFDDIPDDYEFGETPYTTISFDWLDDCHHDPTEHRFWKCDNKQNKDDYPDLS